MSKDSHSIGEDVLNDFILFSGHDGTLLALMTGTTETSKTFQLILLALDLNHLPLPLYAAHFVFELVHLNSTNEYAMKILYNDDILGEYVPVSIPGCQEYCTLDQFHK